MFVLRRRLSSLSRDVRVRFAPSPTGEMHLGGLRTALYNYLYARKTEGRFILRIEDTDQSRLMPGAQERLVETLRWAKLTPDEGPEALGGSKGPYVQSERLHFYREFVQKLIDKGAAYKCFCSERRLDLLRKDAHRRKEIFRYDNRCRSLTVKEANDFLDKESPYVVRFKLKDGPMTFQDVIHGSTTIDVSKAEADFIILKSDGYPTYHLANVVDDHLMEISHVLRGVEWQISTPKHLQMFEALGILPPVYAHLPLMMNSDGTKLSKRNKGFMCDQLKGKYVPEAVLNFLLLSGGGFGQASGDFHPLQKCVDEFDIESMNTNSCKVDFKRLDDMNHQAIKYMVDDLVGEAFNLVIEKYPQVEKKYFEKVFKANVERIKLFDDLLSPQFKYLWSKLKSEEALSDSWKAALPLLVAKLRAASTFEREEIGKCLKKIHSDNFTGEVPYNKFMATLRRLLTGLGEGPGVIEIMQTLGKTQTLDRLSKYC